MINIEQIEDRRQGGEKKKRKKGRGGGGGGRDDSESKRVSRGKSERERESVFV